MNRKAAKMELHKKDPHTYRLVLDYLLAYVTQHPRNLLARFILGEIAENSPEGRKERGAYIEQAHRIIGKRWHTSCTFIERRLKQNPSDPFPYFAYGVWLLSHGLENYGSDDGYLAKAINLDPAFTLAYRVQAAMYRGHDQVGLYVVACKKILELEPDPQGYRELAVILCKLRRWDEEEQAYRRIIQLKPMDQNAHYQLGACLARLCRYEEALLSFQHVAESATGEAYIQTRREIGVCLRNLERYEEAHQVVSEIVGLSPKQAPLHFDLGVCLHYMERLEEAIEAYWQAIRLDQFHRKSYLNCLTAFEALMEKRGIR